MVPGGFFSYFQPADIWANDFGFWKFYFLGFWAPTLGPAWARLVSSGPSLGSLGAQLGPAWARTGLGLETAWAPGLAWAWARAWARA